MEWRLGRRGRGFRVRASLGNVRAKVNGEHSEGEGGVSEAGKGECKLVV